jgi:hypothetical protein
MSVREKEGAWRRFKSNNPMWPGEKNEDVSMDEVEILL